MIIAKNNKVTSDVWAGQTIEPGAEYTLQAVDVVTWKDNLKVNQDILSGDLRISDGTTYFTNFVQALDFLKGSIISSKITDMVDPHPFAQPLYRTKRMKTSAIATVAPGATNEILFQLPSELYTNGGCMIVENAKIGDYIYAEVEDVDSLIPAPYRAALCEAWPVVGQYIIGEWVEVQGQYSVHKINTAPLIAKITPGLYLSMHYVASSEGVDRKVAVNYYMNKKL
jgi:hypothetical protein